MIIILIVDPRKMAQQVQWSKEQRTFRNRVIWKFDFACRAPKLSAIIIDVVDHEWFGRYTKIGCSLSRKINEEVLEHGNRDVTDSVFSHIRDYKLQFLDVANIGIMELWDIAICIKNIADELGAYGRTMFTAQCIPKSDLWGFSASRQKIMCLLRPTIVLRHSDIVEERNQCRVETMVI